MVVLLDLCAMIDAKLSVFGLNSQKYFFVGGGGISVSSGIEPAHDKYLPLPLVDRFLETIEHIRFHLSLNVNHYRDSASVVCQLYQLRTKLRQYNFYLRLHHTPFRFLLIFHFLLSC